MVFREMTIADYSAVIALWRETESLSLRDADSRESIERYLQHNAGLSFVALNNDEIVGAVLVGTDGRRGYLQHLAVASSCRGQKVGQTLVAKSIQALGLIGIEKTHLFVHKENLHAQGFYEKLGWFPRDEVRMYSFNSSSCMNV